jgi:hypothetical protein
MHKDGITLKPAFLVIDVQNNWLNLSPGLNACLERRIDVINSAIALFGKKELSIIRVYHVDRGKDLCRAGRIYWLSINERDEHLALFHVLFILHTEMFNEHLFLKLDAMQ